MILSIIFAHVWGVLQLVLLGSFARTIRIRTILIGMAAGLYGCAIATVILQVAWTRPMAWLTQTSLSEIVGMASYTVDPFIEEIMKVLPLVLLLKIPTIRRQWSYTDCILIGAALGSGFGLAEALFRFGTIPSRVSAEPFGWMIHKLLSTVMVFGPSTILMSWLPDYVAVGDLFSSQAPAPGLNRHLVWSAIAGLAVGLYFLKGDRVGRRAGIALLMYVSVDHASHNFDVSGASGILGILAPFFRVLRYALPVVPLIALVVAWRLDRQRQRGGENPVPLLAVEQGSSPLWHGTLSAALSQFPWSLIWVDKFVRLRRAYDTLPKADTDNSLRRFVHSMRDGIDRLAHQPIQIPPLSYDRTRRALTAILKQPPVLVWLALMIPPVLWFVIGGSPSLAWLQQLLITNPAWLMMLVLSFVGMSWMAVHLLIGLGRWPQAMQEPVADVCAMVSLRLLSGVGALSMGMYSMFLSVTGGSPQDPLLTNFHVLDALSRSSVASALAMALGGLGMAPPPFGPGVAGSPGAGGGSNGNGAHGAGEGGGSGTGTDNSGSPALAGTVVAAPALGESGLVRALARAAAAAVEVVEAVAAAVGVAGTGAAAAGFGLGAFGPAAAGALADHAQEVDQQKEPNTGLPPGESLPGGTTDSGGATPDEPPGEEPGGDKPPTGIIPVWPGMGSGKPGDIQTPKETPRPTETGNDGDGGGGGKDAGSGDEYNQHNVQELIESSEKAGGHFKQKHIGVSEIDLHSRLALEPDRSEVSTFKDIAEAESALNKAIQANLEEMQAWAADGANGTLAIEAPFSGGSVLQRGAPGPVVGTGVRFILLGDGSGGFVLLTGHPTL